VGIAIVCQCMLASCGANAHWTLPRNAHHGYGRAFVPIFQEKTMQLFTLLLIMLT